MSTKTIISIILVILLALGGTFALWQYTKSPSPTEETDGETSEAHGDLPDEKRQATEDEENGDKKNITGNTDEETAGDSDVSILLNNFGQRDDSTVYANATVSGTRDGTCEFRFTRNGSSVTKTADIERAPTGYYACGVRIDNSKFTPKGMWSAQVHVQDTDPKAKSDTKKAKIE